MGAIWINILSLFRSAAMETRRLHGVIYSISGSLPLGLSRALSDISQSLSAVGTIEMWIKSEQTYRCVIDQFLPAHTRNWVRKPSNFWSHLLWRSSFWFLLHHRRWLVGFNRRKALQRRRLRPIYSASISPLVSPDSAPTPLTKYTMGKFSKLTKFTLLSTTPAGLS